MNDPVGIVAKRIACSVVSMALISSVAVVAKAVAWPTVVCGTSLQQYEPTIAPTAPDTPGGGFVVFQGIISGLDLPTTYGAFLDASGTKVPASTCGDALIASGGNPRVTPDGTGGFIVAAEKASDLYANRRDASGNVLWGTGKPVCTAGSDQFFATETFGAMAPDGQGGCYVVWQDQRPGGTGNDVYIQHLIAATGDTAVGWDHNGIKLTGLGAPAETGNEAQASVIADGAGGAIVVWQRAPVGGTNIDIRASRIDASGTLVSGWNQNGNIVCNASNDQIKPTLVSDGAGGAIITWEDGRGGSIDVYAMRMLANGSPDPSWTANGVPLTQASLEQLAPEIASDGAGGAIVAWTDNRNTATDPDVYAQRISVDGQVMWTNDGVPIAVAALDQAHPRLCSDNAGGAVICWDDKRNQVGDPDQRDDIYAQRIWQGGSVLWATDGVPVASGLWEQRSPAIASDGYGGAVIAWRDFKNDRTNGDVHATRVLGSGQVDSVVAVGDGPPESNGLTILPNPATNSVSLALNVPMGGHVDVDVVDLAGRRVRRVASGSLVPRSRLRWELTDESGQRVAPGLYWVRARTSQGEHRRALVVLK